MRPTFLITMILAGGISAANQGCRAGAPHSAVVESEAVPTPKPAQFPTSWIGEWRGTLEIRTPGREGAQHVPMELRIGATDKPDRVSWHLVYGDGKTQQVREYDLLTIDATKGHYRVDEHNSIALDSYLVDESLHSQYSVEGALLTVVYTRHDDAIHFDLSAAALDSPRRTGGVDGTPLVLAYPIHTVQHALLLRTSHE